ncbi:hypothetical protein WJX73_008838 [Symbiochloris irregularis]|uniref:Uncharacterized protein n=1 Tax=Symbiochloris irregularis TaxID=706552 RepID=A0AAW1PIK8_9CHLO
MNRQSDDPDDRFLKHRLFVHRNEDVREWAAKGICQRAKQCIYTVPSSLMWCPLHGSNTTTAHKVVILLAFAQADPQRPVHDKRIGFRIFGHNTPQNSWEEEMQIRLSARAIQQWNQLLHSEGFREWEYAKRYFIPMCRHEHLTVDRHIVSDAAAQRLLSWTTTYIMMSAAEVTALEICCQRLNNTSPTLQEGFGPADWQRHIQSKFDTHCMAFLQPDAQKFQNVVEAVLQRHRCPRQYELWQQSDPSQQYWVSVNRPQNVKEFASQVYHARTKQISFKVTSDVMRCTPPQPQSLTAASCTIEILLLGIPKISADKTVGFLLGRLPPGSGDHHPTEAMWFTVPEDVKLQVDQLRRSNQLGLYVKRHIWPRMPERLRLAADGQSEAEACARFDPVVASRVLLNAAQRQPVDPVLQRRVYVHRQELVRQFAEKPFDERVRQCLYTVRAAPGIQVA